MKTINLTPVLFAVLFFTAAGIKAQVPKLSSYPSATATLFMDFDGQTVTGTSWNWSGPIVAAPAALSNVAITEIFERVSEDYRPFNINVTTDSTVYFAAPFNRRIRIIVTPTSAWYGSAGGVAYVGSFTWGNETPGWVFSTLLGNSTKVVAEAISHEAGHTFGLQHQSSYDASGTKTAEYAAGTGTGEIGWAPIMGVGYYKNLTTWHNGTNTVSSNTFQSDLNIISGVVGYRTDDIGNTANAATNITVDGQSFVVDGIVNRTGDIDAFKLVVPTTGNLTLSAIPENVGNNNSGANVDIRVTILNSNNDTIGSYNPSTLLSAGIDTLLTSGTYYLMVDGVGNVNHSNYGSLGYYSMAGALNVVLPLRDPSSKRNDISPVKTSEKAIQLLSNVVTTSINIKSNNKYPYQLLDIDGKLLGKGELLKGINNLAVPQNMRGLLFLRLNDGKIQWIEKLIKQ